MLKRLVVAASVSAFAFIGIGPVGSAAADSSSEQVSGKAVKAKVARSFRIIDWDAPAPAPSDGGGFTTQRIDWD